MVKIKWLEPKFLKMFGLNSLDELPELPRYKLDENQQIVIDEYIEENQDVQENQVKEEEQNDVVDTKNELKEENN